MNLRVAAQAAFWTVQGEGYLAGEPSIFLRLSGCTVGCPQCDTDYRFSRTMAVSEIVESCQRLREENRRGNYVWITGGEPTDQDLSPLREKLWDSGFFPCLATSGCRKIEPSVHDWFWVSVSPHTVDFPQRSGSELKLVPGLNGLDIWSVNMHGLSFVHRYVQPMHGDQKSLEDCLEWLRQHGDFKMSPQSHKAWGIP